MTVSAEADPKDPPLLYHQTSAYARYEVRPENQSEISPRGHRKLWYNGIEGTEA